MDLRGMVNKPEIADLDEEDTTVTTQKLGRMGPVYRPRCPGHWGRQGSGASLSP